ncbi:hypothetical protein B8W69_27135 [Mycobacterium vulneris]|uniref:Uncharacterized protein n=1 Tax=Mycolicibacterium vulneris TaxID=547163 RepID=A0A1X2KL99_9MYCO|nr:hypothetical protein B8W69_27135 [Mycolicibacterium vulneris]
MGFGGFGLFPGFGGQGLGFGGFCPLVRLGGQGFGGRGFRVRPLSRPRLRGQRFRRGDLCLRLSLGRHRFGLGGQRLGRGGFVLRPRLGGQRFGFCGQRLRFRGQRFGGGRVCPRPRCGGHRFGFGGQRLGGGGLGLGPRVSFDLGSRRLLLGRRPGVINERLTVPHRGAGRGPGFLLSHSVWAR